MSAETELTPPLLDPSGWMPRAITFGAGGVRIICQLGVYATIHDAGLTARVTDWYGCSGGAVCAFFAALGVGTRWIRDCIAILDLQLVGKASEELVLDYMNTWGVNSGEALIQFLGRFADTWEPGSSSWTFADLARERPGTNLHIIATNISRGCQAIFNATNTPTIRVLDAVRASSGIPLFFTPWRSPEGEIFCDGAIIETYPWLCVKNKDDTLVLINSDKDIKQFRGTDMPWPPPTSLPEYLTRIFYTLRRGHVTSLTSPKHWIAVNNRDVSIFDFGVTLEQRTRLFAEGEMAGRGWIAFMRVRCAATTRNPHVCAHPNTCASDHSEPDKKSDNHQSGIRSPPPHLSRDSQTRRSRDRRWSL
jgi:predicted acylesterase/phospholipase RssA